MRHLMLILIAGWTIGQLNFDSRLAAADLADNTPVVQKPVVAPSFAQSGNIIDRLIAQRLVQDGLKAAPLCKDDEFIRRAYLDVCGTVPPLAEVKAFLADKSSSKRERLISTLLASERYADHWLPVWGDLLREHSKSKNKEGTMQGSYRAWIHDALAKNLPYDQFATQLITASGTPDKNGAVNFYLRDQNNRVESANTLSQVFMGTRISCAQCHDHPFDKWTQEDFHGLVAYFARVKLEKLDKSEKNSLRSVAETPKGEYNMPADGDGAAKKRNNSGAVVAPVFPWDHSQKLTGTSRLADLARMTTQSRQFAEVQANRIWGRLMGRGLVEPMDDFRAKNPPSYPELLDCLTDEFIRAKMDNKKLISLIMNSQVYQRSSVPNEYSAQDEYYFARHKLRRMEAEEIFDSILVAAGFKEGLEDVPGLAGKGKGSRKAGNKKLPMLKGDVEWASDLTTPAPNGSFMNMFNQPQRDTTAVSRDDAGSISQALELMNSDHMSTVLQRSPIAARLETSKHYEEVIRDLYLSILTREPTFAEYATLKTKFQPGREFVSDLQWALFNSREFQFVK